MIEEAEARGRILKSTPAAESELVRLAEAGGRFAMRDVLAGVPLPGFDQSAMDGYAVRAEDLGGEGQKLKVVGEMAAGEVERIQVGAGEAARIFTGAPMPTGADTVVMQEDVNREGDAIRVEVEVEQGEFVRRQGEVLCQGQTILKAGEELTPGRIGLLATQGLAEIEVGKVPQVAVLTTGDELVEPGTPLGDGEIFNSNAPMLEASLRAIGISKVRSWHAPDRLEATKQAVLEALEWADVLLVAGGVSVGERDFVKPALAECGVATDFWRVRVKPGKPLLHAMAENGVQVFGLPGNPVSASVTYALFVVPSLKVRMGAGEEQRRFPEVQLSLDGDVRNRGDRPHYVRGRISPAGWFHPGSLQVSHDVRTLADADGLLRVDAGEEIVSGQGVTVLRFS